MKCKDIRLWFGAQRRNYSILLRWMLSEFSLPRSQSFYRAPNLTFCVLCFLIGCRSLGWLPSYYWNLCAPCTSRELDVPGVYISWQPSDNEWVVQDNESLAALPGSRQIQRHIIEFILSSLGGILGLVWQRKQSPLLIILNIFRTLICSEMWKSTRL